MIDGSWGVFAFEALELIVEFAARAHGTDFHAAKAPAGEFAYFAQGFFLEIEQLQDHALVRLESGEQSFHQLTSADFPRLMGRGGIPLEQGINKSGVCLGEVGKADFRPRFLAAQLIVAGIERDARHPVGKRLDATEGIDGGEDFHENLLHEIQFVEPVRQVVSNNTQDMAIEPLDEAGGRLVASLSGKLDGFIPIWGGFWFMRVHPAVFEDGWRRGRVTRKGFFPRQGLLRRTRKNRIAGRRLVVSVNE